MMIDAERGVFVVLDDVATALLDAGYGDPYVTTPGLRLRCLRASGCLEVLGARTHRGCTADASELAGFVAVALGVVLLLDHDRAIVAGAVSDALDALQAVLRELG